MNANVKCKDLSHLKCSCNTATSTEATTLSKEIDDSARQLTRSRRRWNTNGRSMRAWRGGEILGSIASENQPVAAVQDTNWFHFWCCKHTDFVHRIYRNEIHLCECLLQFLVGHAALPQLALLDHRRHHYLCQVRLYRLRLSLVFPMW